MCAVIYILNYLLLNNGILINSSANIYFQSMDPRGTKVCRKGQHCTSINAHWLGLTLRVLLCPNLLFWLIKEEHLCKQQAERIFILFIYFILLFINNNHVIQCFFMFSCQGDRQSLLKRFKTKLLLGGPQVQILFSLFFFS